MHGAGLARAAAALAAAGAAAGCFGLETRGCGRRPFVEVTVYVAPPPAAPAFADADRMLVQVVARDPSGVETVIDAQSFPARPGVAVLGSIPFADWMRVQVEVRNGAGTVIAYGGSALHALGESDAVDMASIAAFVSPVGTAVPVVRELDGAESIMGRGRVGHSVTLLDDGRVLVAGGGFAGGPAGGVDPMSITAGVDLWDPESGWFETVTNGLGSPAPLTRPRAFHTATLLPDGSVLIAGGLSALNGSLVTASDAERIDYPGCIQPPGFEQVMAIPCGVFPELNVMADARAYHAATLLPDGQVLLSGGALVVSPVEAPPLASTELWSDGGGFAPGGGPPMNDERVFHTQTLLPGGAVLVTGGVGIGPAGAPELLASAELYDGGAWTAIGGMAGPRAFHSATLATTETGDTWVLVTGGYSAFGPGGWFGQTTSLVESYDPALGFITSLARVITGLQSGAADQVAVALKDGRVVLAGGVSGGTAVSAVVLVAAGSSGPVITYDGTAALRSPRAGARGVTLPSGQVLVAGGYGVAGGGPVTYDTAEVFTAPIPR